MSRKKERFKGCRELAAFRPGERLTQGEWERVFGPEDERRERFKAAVKAQNEQRELEKVSAVNSNGVAIHDDRDWGHKGVYSPCLGERIYSRTHQKELERKYNVRCVN